MSATGIQRLTKWAIDTSLTLEETVTDLIMKINFPAFGVVVVRWFGTHAEYDKIKVEEI